MVIQIMNNFTIFPKFQHCDLQLSIELELKNQSFRNLLKYVFEKYKFSESFILMDL